MTPLLRGKTYHLKLRVPARFRAYDERKFVWVSLRTDSFREAQRRMIIERDRLIAEWEARRAGRSDHAEKRHQAARDLAEAKGFRFIPMDQVAQLPIEEVLSRIEAIRMHGGKPDMFDAAALLGKTAAPEIKVSRALEIYFEITEDRLLGKSTDQVRRWENPRKKAVANFIAVNGDIAIHQITGDSMQDFKDWWVKRIRAEGLSSTSANKDLVHLGDILKTVNTQKRLKLDLPVRGYALPISVAQQGAAFSEKWIKDKIIKNPALMKLNQEARGILLGMVNTGYRPSEGAGLSGPQIRLDTTVPHISIEPNGRQLKTQNSERVIPLAGVSLEAFKENPNGFPRYFDKAGLSATVNKFMRENEMMETEEHTVYGLRHSFEDRMLDRDVDERIRRDLMGHALNRERYGKGASLEKLLEIVTSVAL